MTHHIDMTGALSVARISTRRTPLAQRWTELELFYVPGARLPWVLETRGHSKVQGEETRTRRVALRTMDKALRVAGEGNHNGRVMRSIAEDWCADNYALIAGDAARQAPGDRPNPALQIDGDKAALEWLYGQLDEGEGRARPTFASMFAEDFNLPRRTVETAIQKGTDLRVPLLAILPFIDRAAFRASRKGDKA